MTGISRGNVLRISVSVSDSRVYLMTTFTMQSVGSEGAWNRKVHSRFAPGRTFPMVNSSSEAFSEGLPESRCHKKDPCAGKLAMTIEHYLLHLAQERYTEFPESRSHPRRFPS